MFTLAKCAVGVPPAVCDWSGLKLNGGFLRGTEGRRNPQKLAGLKFRDEVMFVCALLNVFV